MTAQVHGQVKGLPVEATEITPQEIAAQANAAFRALQMAMEALSSVSTVSDNIAARNKVLIESLQRDIAQRGEMVVAGIIRNAEVANDIAARVRELVLDLDNLDHFPLRRRVHDEGTEQPGDEANEVAASEEPAR